MNYGAFFGWSDVIFQCQNELERQHYYAISQIRCSVNIKHRLVTVTNCIGTTATAGTIVGIFIQSDS